MKEDLFNIPEDEKLNVNITDLYLKDVKKCHTLSDEETKEILSRIADGDEKAYDELVTGYLPLAIKQAAFYNKKCSTRISFDDLIQEANLGLFHAAKYFNPQNGKFGPYAKKCINGFILKYINKSYFKNENTADDPVQGGEGIEHLLQNPQMAHSDYDSPDKRLKQKDNIVTVNLLMNALNEQEQEVVSYYYGVNDCPECDANDLAEKYGVTATRIRQILRKAKSKMREYAKLHKIGA